MAKKKVSKKKAGSKHKRQTGYTMRQLIIIGVGVLAVLGIALVLILTSRAPSDIPSITGTVEGEQVLLATANGIEIYSDEVEMVRVQLQQQTGQQVTQEQALEQTITMKLLVSEAERRGHGATASDVEAFIEAQGFPAEQLRSEIEAQGMDYEEFLEEQAEQLTLQNFVESLAEETTATEEDARQIFDEQVAPTTNETYEEYREDILSFIREQQAIQEIQVLADELYMNAEIEYQN